MEKFSITFFRRGNDKIYIETHFNGHRSRKSTGYLLTADQWDDGQQTAKNHKLANHINAALQTLKNNASKELIESQITGKPLTRKRMDFFTFVESWVKEVSGKRSESTLENYRKHLKRLKEFRSELTLEDITSDFLTQYENHLRESVGNNYTHKLLTTLKTWIIAAVKKGFIHTNPFTNWEFPQYVSPVKDYLSISELKAWEAAETKHRVTQVWFLFGCYTGLRISDWFRFTTENVVNGRIRLRTKKTGTWISMPISTPLQRVLKLVKKHPLDIEEPTINEKLKVIARGIKLKKHITSHSGRHTFAVTLCLENKISSETAAELMGITLKTFVENYSQVNDEKINKETSLAWANLQ